MTERWQTLAIRDTNSARLWMDAYLAGFALRGGLQLITTDKAVAQFNGLHLRVLTLKCHSRRGFGTRSHLGLPGRFKEGRNPSAHADGEPICSHNGLAIVISSSRRTDSAPP